MMFSQIFLQSPAIIDLEAERDNIASLNSFAPTIEHYLRGVLFVAGLLTFGYMVWGGVDWILSGGDTGKVESARKKITQAMIGLTVLASVAAIFLVLQYFLGINVLDGGSGDGVNNKVIPIEQNSGGKDPVPVPQNGGKNGLFP